MREVKKIPAGQDVLQVTYIAGLELLGEVWLSSDTLLVRPNPFAANSLKETLKLWAEQWNLKLDSQEFIDRLSLGTASWRWEGEPINF